MIKLVLSDVDGTLVPFGEEHASARTLAAIHRLRKGGIRFGLATGRDEMELLRQFEGHSEPFETGILSNGKKIKVDGEVVRLTLLDNDGLNRMAKLIAEYPETFVTAYPLEATPENDIYCVGATEEEIAPWAEKFSFRPMVVDEFPDVEVLGATIACPHEESMMLEIIERGKELCPEFDFVRPSAKWTDIVPKGVNKGTALEWLVERLGITKDEVAMFGDADNDLAILSALENAVVVQNATPAAKAAASVEIGPVEEDAVAQILERMV
ncbi:MAG: HAD family phosphatase [Atopobiaceae bacterium]|nr:HAD family phosphatase [Atopobiaceae bacterium]